MNSLTLVERLFLLSIDDDKGKITAFVSDPIRFGLIGALLAELAYQEKIVLKEKRILIQDNQPLEDPLMNDFLTQISAEGRAFKVKHWVDSLASRKLASHVGLCLVKKNVLRIDEKSYTWVIPYVGVPEKNTSAKYWVKQHLREIILAGETPDPLSVVLLGLVRACRMSDLLFTIDERRFANKKGKELMKSEVFPDSLREIFKEIIDAVTASTFSAG